MKRKKGRGKQMREASGDGKRRRYMVRDGEKEKDDGGKGGKAQGGREIMWKMERRKQVREMREDWGRG